MVSEPHFNRCIYVSGHSCSKVDNTIHKIKHYHADTFGKTIVLSSWIALSTFSTAVARARALSIPRPASLDMLILVMLNTAF